MSMRWLPILLVAACSKEPPPPTPDPGIPLVPPVAIADAPPVEPGLRTQIFASDINVTQMPLSISIETLGGVASIVIPRGTKLPATFADMFSTSADDQVSVEVALALGERAFARDNISVGKFQIYDIPPAPRATPQIDVSIIVDERGMLEARAVDRATGTSRSMRMTREPPPPIDRTGIDAALAAASSHRAADEAARTRVNSHIQLQTLRIGTKRSLDEKGDKVPAALRARVETALASAEKVNADWETGTAATVIAEAGRLQAVAHELATK
jgi:molecular chaperone DnaK